MLANTVINNNLCITNSEILTNNKRNYNEMAFCSNFSSFNLMSGYDKGCNNKISL
jgi:hypothetical protein